MTIDFTKAFDAEWQYDDSDQEEPAQNGGQLPDMMTADELLGHEFAEPRFVVPGIVCEGLSILAGRPKLGKSWSALDWAIAVSAGGMAYGSIQCEAGDVLMLALEDSHRRIKSRLQRLGVQRNPRLTVAIRWPRLDDGCIEKVRKWHDEHPNARLTIIDTLAKIRPAKVASKDAYQADADALEALHRLANERGVAIVVVHHTRKAVAEDWLDSVSGTTGLTGAADSTIVLKRERGQADAFLFGTGRDLPDFELPLRFDEESCRWARLDMTASEARATSDQTAIIDVLRKVPCGLMRHQIAAMTDRSKEATSNMLARMEAQGIVERKNGIWRVTCL